MKTKNFLLLITSASLGCPVTLLAQVSPAYEVATWRGFKAAAVTYTLDDNTANQLPVAIPLFDQYNFKTTLFTVTNWGPNWGGLRAASANGHEVTSHTVTHPSLGGLTVAQQLAELQQSQATIRANVPTAKCETVAYPFCVTGNVPTIQSYYIAGRICNDQIMPATPSDFYNLTAISTGNASRVQTTANFNAKVDAARTARGWCVFLTHGINNDGGYSPTQSTELAGHLAYMNANNADFWVGTFADVVKYIKERNAAVVTESTVSATQFSMTLTDNLPDLVYNVPVTVRRQLPTTWTGATVMRGTTPVPSSLVTSAGVRYVVFEAVPDQGAVQVMNAATVTGTLAGTGTAQASIWPNPYSAEMTVALPGPFEAAVYSVNGKLVWTGRGSGSLKIGAGLAAGSYLLKVIQQGRVVETRTIEKQ
ncbi:polysaccharide deacetylase family protein [Hymenobacter sp. BT730]|uniref:polysaccharide deacetylase family protein n=1 Tax=Hymenobacter sp. BT730 TaxID=3063332 RepID=UPI0026DF9B46|nr:polysaccharide deacetylase family protein [Hymenobacter sp. BT730]